MVERKNVTLRNFYREKQKSTKNIELPGEQKKGLKGKKTLKQILPMFLILLLCSFLMAGCSGASGTNQEKEQADQSSEDKVHLSVWAFFDENTPGTYYVDLWDELAEKYGYEIELKTYSTEQIKDKLKIALVCDEMPDIFAVWGGNYPDFLFDADACIPVENYLKEADVQFADSYVQSYEDGHNYIIPCLVEAYAVTYCNQELMQKMGLSVPQTWEELLDLVQKVNAYNEKNGTDYAAIELGDKDSWLGELLYTVIVNRLDPYAQDKLVSGQTDLTDPVFLQAADMLMQLKEMHAFPENMLELGEVEAVQNFADGKAVLFPHQSTIVYHLLDEMGADAVSMEQFPSCNPEYDTDYARYMVDINHTLTPGLCISSNTKYPDQAAELCLDFATKVNERNVTQYDYVDIVKESSLKATADSPLAVQQFHAMLDQAKHYTPLWYAVLNQTDGDNWRNLTRKLLGGAVSPQEFVQDAGQYLNWR